MPTVIDFAAEKAARQTDLSTFDTLACMYCDRPTEPSYERADGCVIYRCACRRVFRISSDGAAYRGVSGRAF